MSMEPIVMNVVTLTVVNVKHLYRDLYSSNPHVHDMCCIVAQNLIQITAWSFVFYNYIILLRERRRTWVELNCQTLLEQRGERGGMGVPGEEEERDQPRKDRSGERMGKRKRGERGRGRESLPIFLHTWPLT